MQGNPQPRRTGLPRPDIRSLLQDQQAMLQRILSKQEAFETRQLQLETRLTKIESAQSSVASTSTCSSDGTGKRKQTVSRGLSVSFNKNVL